MSFTYFDNAVGNDIATSDPDTWYRDLQQAFISSEWENTTSLRKIQEQDVTENQDDYYENFTFREVEAWVRNLISTSLTGSKSGRDFVGLVFEDINHEKLEGRYYIIDEQYYISYFDSRVVDVDANLSVRRCNEWMKIIDPLNGSIYKIPVVVDYDMSAPANKVTSYIITPNNHAVVKVQQNATTDRLFVTNARFILGNRPFKIAGMQNATNQFIDNNVSSLMEIDLFLDEIWDGDDIANGIADNGTYNYALEIVGEDMSLTDGTTGTLYTNITLNGNDVTKPVIWSSSNDKAVEIDENGVYTVDGHVGDEAIIKATLVGNENVYDTITITIADQSSIAPEVVIEPSFTSIREYETLVCTVYGFYNGELYNPNTVVVTIPDWVSDNLSYTQQGNEITFKCSRRYSGGVIPITFDITSTSPAFTASKSVDIKLTSLLG